MTLHLNLSSAVVSQLARSVTFFLVCGIFIFKTLIFFFFPFISADRRSKFFPMRFFIFFFYFLILFIQKLNEIIHFYPALRLMTHLLKCFFPRLIFFFFPIQSRHFIINYRRVVQIRFKINQTIRID